MNRKKIGATVVALVAMASVFGTTNAIAATHPAPPNPCNVQVGTCHIRFK